jgi:hypothetical protein
MLLVFLTQTLFLYIILSPPKKYVIGLQYGIKRAQLYIKKSLRTKLKYFKNLTIKIHNKMWNDEQ